MWFVNAVGADFSDESDDDHPASGAVSRRSHRREHLSTARVQFDQQLRHGPQIPRSTHSSTWLGPPLELAIWQRDYSEHGKYLQNAGRRARARGAGGFGILSNGRGPRSQPVWVCMPIGIIKLRA